MHFATCAAAPGPFAVGTSIGEWGIGYGTAHEAHYELFCPFFVRSHSTLHILQNVHKIHKIILVRLANLPYLDAVQNLVAEVVAV